MDYFASKDKELEAFIFDLTGRLISTQTQGVTEGYNRLSFDFSLFEQGIYIVKWGNGTSTDFKRLIIK